MFIVKFNKKKRRKSRSCFDQNRYFNKSQTKPFGDVPFDIKTMTFIFHFLSVSSSYHSISIVIFVHESEEMLTITTHEVRTES